MGRSSFTVPILAVVGLAGVVALFVIWFTGTLPIGSLPLIGQLSLSLPSTPIGDRIVLALQPVLTGINEAQALPASDKVLLCILIPLALLVLVAVTFFVTDLARKALHSFDDRPGQEPVD